MLYDGEQEVFLEYTDQVKIKDSYYQIQLREIILENEDLISALVTSLLILLLAASGIAFFVSRKMNKTIWADFERDLFKIENFRITDNKKLDLTKSDIEEFDRLNKVITRFTNKLQSDFRSLKEFTENASHEIQTPLSIVLLNLEEVLQQDLNEETFAKVISSINAAKKLSNLNKSLILLTKIENDQFKADKLISFQNLIKQKIEEFTVLFESKNISTQVNVEHDFGIKMNGQLAEVLINNLLSNAVNHNLSGGIIEIFMNEKEFRISNTGEDHFLNNDNIFNRFVKGNSKSYGLGLSIVKKICESNRMSIRYEKNERHCFTIKHV
jgi:signal transduction histidine kinase